MDWTGSTRSLGCGLITLFLIWAEPGVARNTKTPYPRMVALSMYLMQRDAEISLARSAAPVAISKDATVLALSPQRYETALKGTNGFVCVVERSWSAGSEDPDFWNPKLRAPICFNASAARAEIPALLKRTELILHGASKDQMFAALQAGYAKGELKKSEPGAMCYMMSKDGYLSDKDGHFKPHLMFFIPGAEPSTWGAGVTGSPVLGFRDRVAGETTFIVPVSNWSDGEPAGAH